LFTTRCSHPLCNTQHTTTHPDHQTTTTPTNPITEIPDALDGRPERRPENNTHTQQGAVVFSGPNSVPNFHHEPATPKRGTERSNVPPSHTHQPSTPHRSRKHQASNPKAAYVSMES
jgi:hypothetical protein